ncbi:MAG: O-antigen/teichoic acid export membrane protein [Psychroserpens sp.]|jgi:O-antigen/teichoic acid export membrane protein
MQIIKKLKDPLLLKFLLSVVIRALGAFSTIFLSIYLGRKLGVSESGLFFLTFTVITVLSAIARLGLDNTVLRFTGSSDTTPESSVKDDVLFKSVVLTICTSTVISVILFLFSGQISNYIFNKTELTPLLSIMSASLISVSLITLVSMSLQGDRKIISAVVFLNVSTNLLLIIFMSLFEAVSAVDTALLFLSSTYISLITGCIWWYKKAYSNSKSHVTWHVLLSSCLPLLVVVFMTQMIQFSGQLVSGVLLSTAEIAQLSVAQRTAMLTSFILMAVNLVVAPNFAMFFKNKEMAKLKNLAIKSVRIMIIVSTPLLLLMMVIPSQIMSIFGEGFSDGSLYLQILALGQFVNVMTGSVGYLLSMSGHEKDLRNMALIIGPFAILLSLILIPLYGAIGSAIATALAVGVQNLLGVYWVRKRLGFNTLKIW